MMATQHCVPISSKYQQVVLVGGRWAVVALVVGKVVEVVSGTQERGMHFQLLSVRKDVRVADNQSPGLVLVLNRVEPLVVDELSCALTLLVVLHEALAQKVVEFLGEKKEREVSLEAWVACVLQTDVGKYE